MTTVNMTFKELYIKARELPNPAQTFIKKVAVATDREEATVRQWLSGTQTPSKKSKARIAVAFNSSVDELFPSVINNSNNLKT